MSLDNSGAVVNNYKGEYTYNYPFGHNMLWDQATSEVVTSFTTGNTNIANTAVPGPPSAIPASVITVMKLDDNTLNVPGNSSDFYYFMNGTENYAYGIVENQSRTGYVIGGWTYDRHTYSPPDPQYNYNICLLEVDKTTAARNYFHKFNVFKETNTAATAYNDDMMGNVNYVVAGNKRNGLYDGDIRVVSADVAGLTCGGGQWPDGRGTVAHGQENPIAYINFIEYAQTGHFTDILNTPSASTTVDDCYTAPDPNHWKPTGIENVVTNSSVSVYPTILTSNIQALTIELNAVNSTVATVSIFSIDGRKVAGQTYKVSAGENKFSLPISLPSSGNYIMKIHSPEEGLQGNIRLTNL
jgi:hypothetical protein